MKQIFTLLAIALLSNFASNAQTETFDGGSASLTSNCWRFSTVSDVTSATSSGTPISIVSIGMDAMGVSNISTPYYDLNGTTTVSFKYKFSQNLNGLATRTVEVGSTDVAGVFTPVSSATVVFDKDNDPTTTQNFATVTIPATGTKRLTIRTTGSNGDGQCYLIFDDMVIANAAYHYAPSTCNTAPVAGNDMFTTFNALAYSGSVSGNDSDPNVGESISASIVVAPSATVGTVSLSSNGNFTFTPAVGFLGGPVSFTYRVTDNGFDPLSSSTATVTINYPELSPLPVHLISFNGSIVNDKAQLKWLVAGNETGDHFEIQKSDDGKIFSTESVVFLTATFGDENYTYNSALTFNGQAYYRLKILNKDGSIDYSRTIVLKNQNAAKNNSLVILQNPVDATLMFQYTAAKANKSMVNIYNMGGAKMLTTSVSVQAGFNSVSINLDGKFNSGTYILELINGTERSTTKLIKK